MKSYSVLMSVYYKESPVFFAEAIQSMVEQTVRTDDFVIVCDGPLSQALDEVLEALNFYGAVLEGEELVVKPEQALKVTEILNAIYESAKTGKAVYF